MRNLAIRFLDTTLACWISTLLFVGGGCSTDHVASQVASMNDANIKRVSNLYYAYQRSHGWQGPKDEMALKQFIKHDMDPKKLGLMNVDPANLDELLSHSAIISRSKFATALAAGQVLMSLLLSKKPASMASARWALLGQW